MDCAASIEVSEAPRLNSGIVIPLESEY